jgi:hypothetical protein
MSGEAPLVILSWIIALGSTVAALITLKRLSEHRARRTGHQKDRELATW